jgi:hypothetical protein
MPQAACDDFFGAFLVPLLERSVGPPAEIEPNTIAASSS